MTEFELKFQVPEDATATVQAALEHGEVHHERLRARYYDTRDEALARAGLVLRLRQEGRAWVQTVKAPGADAFHRLEHDVPLSGATPAAPDLQLHADHPVGALLQQALAGGHAPLELVFETDIGRSTRSVSADGSAIEIAFDRGAIRANGRNLQVLELEFELKQGNPVAVVDLAQRWCEEHGLWLDPLSKSAAGRRLARDHAAPPPVHATPVDRADSLQGWLRALVASGLQQVLGNAREVAAGTGSDEHIHQLRGGLRRLRTLLRELAGFERVARLQAEASPALEHAFRLLGEHRDRATLVPQLQAELAAAGAPPDRWQPILPDAAALVRAPAFQAALLRLLAFTQQPQPTRDAIKAARRLVRKRLQQLHRRAFAAGSAFHTLDEAERHRVRKRIKRLRNLAELTRALFKARRVDRYVDALKDLQDALGRYQDAATARRLFTERAADEPRAWFAVGWLTAREPQLARACGLACRAAARATQPYWEG